MEKMDRISSVRLRGCCPLTLLTRSEVNKFVGPKASARELSRVNI